MTPECLIVEPDPSRRGRLQILLRPQLPEGQLGSLCGRSRGAGPVRNVPRCQALLAELALAVFAEGGVPVEGADLGEVDDLALA